MVDELYDRSFRQARPALSHDLGRLARRLVVSVGIALRALHRIQFSAPWSVPQPQTRRSAHQA